MSVRVRPVNLAGGDAAVPFAALADAAFAAVRDDLHRYFVGDLSKVAVPTPGPALIAMLPRLQRRGLLPASLLPGRLLHRVLMLGSGATEGFALTLAALQADVAAPAILFPVPSYGLFIQAACRQGFAPIVVPRDLPGGALDPERLRAAAAAAERDGQRIVAFYDSNPHNPLGLVRGRAETAALAAVLAEITARQRRGDAAAGHAWSGPASRVRIVDDLVDDGLEFDGPPGASFAEIDAVAADTVVLTSLSKLGLAGLRAGLLLADPDLIRRAVAHQIDASYFPNLPAMKALELYFGEDDGDWRREHLDALNATHRSRGRLLHALVDGIDAVAPDAAERAAMVATVAAHAGIDPAEAHARLARGIPGVRVVTRPRAGFFHMLDMSGLRRRRVRLPSGELSAPIADEAALEPVEDAFGLSVCFGVWTGLDPAAMLQRVSFAVPEATLVAGAARLAALAAAAEPE